MNDHTTAEMPVTPQSNIDPLDQLPPDEAAHLRKYREQKAEEEQRRQRWHTVFDDLDAGRENDNDYRSAAIEFVRRFCGYDWPEIDYGNEPEDVLGNFVEMLMLLLGYYQQDVHKHGTVWKWDSQKSEVAQLINAQGGGLK